MENGVASALKFTGLFFAERGRNRCRSPILDVSIRSGYTHNQSLKCPKSTLILHVFGPNFLGGSSKFRDIDYHITEYFSDHVQKFRGDRPTELGDLVVKKERK